MAAISLVVLLVVLSFVATSSTFLKAVVLPRVSSAIGATITAADVSLSPFSQLVLTQPKLETTGAEPLFSAQTVRVRYRLTDVLRGRLNVAEVTVAAPTVSIVQNADGTSNLDPILAALKAQKKPKPPKPPKPEKLWQIDVHNVALNQATLRWVRNQKGGGRQVAELANFQISVDTVQNGQSGKLTLGADARFEQVGASNSTPPNSIAAKLAGTYDFSLDAALLPKSAKGALNLSLGNASGAFADLTSLAANLDCEWTPTEVRRAALQFSQSGQQLGQIRLSGPIDLAKTEAHLKLEVLSIDRHVLNLLGAARGWDFGRSVLNATSQVDVTPNASAISARGQSAAQQLSLTQTGLATPPLDLSLDYAFTADLTRKTALIEKFALLGKQNGTELLQTTLDRPMQLSWGGRLGQFVESAWELKVTGLELNDWRRWLGIKAPAGKVALQLKLLAQDEGHRLKTDLRAQLQGVSAVIGTNSLSFAEIRAQASGQVEDFNKLAVSQFQFEARQPDRLLATASGSAGYDLGSHRLHAQVNVEASVPGALQLFPLPEVNASSGQVKLTAQVSQTGRVLAATGHLEVVKFTGGYGQYQLRNLQPSADYDVDLNGSRVQFKRLALVLQQGSTPAGRCDLSGGFDLARKSGQADFDVADLNQNVLAPFLSARLAPDRLVSISVNGTGSAKYDPQQDSAVKARFDVQNLVVEDPEHRLPRTPWSAQFQLDGALKRQILDLRQFRVVLAPTARAKNQLDARGRLDFSQPGGASGKLSMTADSLDLTPLYDLLAGPLRTNAAAHPVVAESQRASPSANVEPAPVRLPLQQFALDLSIGRLYLREVAITNWTATTAIDHGRVTLTLFQLTLNGAPVNANATLNLAVPGFTYDVSFKADSIPVQPLANTFSPTYAGQAKGDLFVQAQLKGAGVTGANLRRTLTGQCSLSLTNADIQLVSPKMNVLLLPIASLLRVSEITQSPLNSIEAQLAAANGEINIARVGVESAAFHAYTQGSVSLADVLTNSPINHLPVDFYLSRGIAGRAHLVGLGADPNVAFVKLPNFLKIGGTVGAPKAETDDLVITGLIAGSAAGFVGGKAGSILQGVGGLLSGGRQILGGPSTNSTPDTNAPPKVINPLNLLNNLFKK